MGRWKVRKVRKAGYLRARGSNNAAKWAVLMAIAAASGACMSLALNGWAI